MRARRVVPCLVAFACACGARSALDGFSASDAAMSNDADATIDAVQPDASSEVALCAYANAPCDAGVVAVCDGCAAPTVLATCQLLPGALALDDATVLWINEGVASPSHDHKFPRTFDGGALMRCAKGGCGGMPSPIVMGLYNAWIRSFAASGAWSFFLAMRNDGPAIFTVDDSTCTTAPAGFSGAGFTFAADETRVYYTTWSGNTVNECSTIGCVSPTVVWAAPTPNIFTMGIAVDATDIYWSTSHGELYRCAKSGCGTNPALVTHTLSGIGALALDGANVYAVGAGLLSCPKSGCAQPTVLTTIDEPDGTIVTDGVNIYWGRLTGGVFRCAVGGCAAPEMIAAVVQPGGIAVDDANVYWSDTTTGTVSSLSK